MGAANTGRRDLKKLEEPTGQVCVIDAAGCELLQQRVEDVLHHLPKTTAAAVAAAWSWWWGGRRLRQSPGSLS